MRQRALLQPDNGPWRADMTSSQSAAPEAGRHTLSFGRKNTLGPGSPEMRRTGLRCDPGSGVCSGRRFGQRGQSDDAAQGEHRRPGAGEGLAAGAVPAASATVAAGRCRRSRLVRLPGPCPAQRPHVSGPAAADHRAGLRAGAAPDMDPPGHRRRRLGIGQRRLRIPGSVPGRERAHRWPARPGRGAVAVCRAGGRRCHRGAVGSRHAGLAGAPGGRPGGGDSAHGVDGGDVPEEQRPRRCRSPALAAC